MARLPKSVFIAGLFCLAAGEMAGLASAAGIRRRMPVNSTQAAAKMDETTLEHGWDGDWFRRAYDDFGEPVGSQLNQ